MARKLSHSLIVNGDLVATTPIHVGGAEAVLVTDRPLAVDGLGRYYIPGTSIGGAIRSFCCVEPNDEHWGFVLGDDQGTASRFVIDDAPATDQLLSELWQGNGIDRRSGTVSDGIKFDYEVLPQGTRFCFRLMLEVDTTDSIDTRRAWLGQLLQVLEAGDVPLGAGSTRGLGRIRLEATRCQERIWNTPEGILKSLDPSAIVDCRNTWDELAKGLPPLATRRGVQIAIHWQPTGPLMSKAVREGVMVDAVPFLSSIEDSEKLALTLPGTGIKGAWRSHAERIVRTVTSTDCPVDSVHLDQIDVPIAGDLFGRARPSEETLDNARPGRRKARLAVETCYAKFTLSREKWDALECSTLNSNLPMNKVTHVAVDRWTGGAADSLLYTAIEPGNIEWNPIVMHFDANAKPLVEFALWWLTLCDFCNDHIPLGFGVNRGYGSLKVTKIVMSGLHTLSGNDEHACVTLGVSDTSIETQPLQGLLDEAAHAWQAWLDQREVAS